MKKAEKKELEAFLENASRAEVEKTVWNLSEKLYLRRNAISDLESMRERYSTDMKHYSTDKEKLCDEIAQLKRDLKIFENKLIFQNADLIKVQFVSTELELVEGGDWSNPDHYDEIVTESALSVYEYRIETEYNTWRIPYKALYYVSADFVNARLEYIEKFKVLTGNRKGK